MKKDFVPFVPFLLLFFVVILSIGYSALGTELSIGKIALDVRIEANVRVTGIEIDSYTEGVISSGEEYNIDLVRFDVKLPEENSTVTYKVQVTNFGSAEMGILDISGLPENLDYDITDYNLEDKICDVNSNCTLGAVKEFYITIKYKSDETYSGYDINNLDYSVTLQFDFREVLNISYEYIVDHDYPTTVLKGTDFVLDFVTDIPEGIYIKNMYSYVYESPRLTVTNVESDMVISNTLVYYYPGEYVFNGSNYIDTGVYLFNEENFDRNFEVSFTISSYSETQERFASLFNSMDEFNPDYPGVVFRANNAATNYEIVANNKANNFLQASESFAYDSVTKVKIVRINDIIYFSVNDGDYFEFQDYTVFNEYFDISATFGASYDENGEPFRYFNGTLSNMKIKFLDRDVSIESYDIEYNQKGSLVFDGTNYVDTGVYLFNEENASKDFRIRFTITASNATQETYATLVNSLNEFNSDYPGIAFRIYSTTPTEFQMVANGATKLSERFNVADVTKVEILRESNILYYRINDEDYVQFQDYSEFTDYFDVPVTFGASLDKNGDPYRYFVGTLSNFEVRIKDVVNG